MADPLENASLLKPGAVGTGVSARAMEAIPRGAEAMGKAIQAVGGGGVDIAMKLQQAENATALAEIRRGARERAAAAEQDMLSDPTGDHWVDIVNKHMESYKGEISQRKGLGPLARQEAEIFLQDFRSKMSMDVQTKAMLKKFERAEEAVMMEVEDAIGRGDLDTANRSVDSLSHWSPEKKESVKKRAEKKVVTDQVEAAVLTDPWNVPPLPEWMPEAEKAKIDIRAKAAKDSLIADSLQDIAKRVDMGHLNDKDQIWEAIEGDPILMEATEEERILFYDAINKKVPIDRDEAASLRGMITSLSTIRENPELGDDVYEQEWNNMAKQLSLLGNRPGAEELRKELELRSLPNLAEAEKDFNKSYSLKAYDAVVRANEAARLSITDSEKKTRAGQVDALVADELKARAESYGYENIRKYDAEREPNTPTWHQKEAKQIRTHYAGQADLSPILDIIFPDNDNPGNQLLGPKPASNNLLGESR